MNFSKFALLFVIFVDLSGQGLLVPLVNALVMEQHTGLLPDGASLRFTLGDPGAIADAVSRLADPDLRRSLRTEALLAVEDYRPQTVLSRLEEVLAREGCPLPTQAK